VALQLLLAATFVISAIEVLTSGVAAEAAAKAELVRQGFPADVLHRPAPRVHLEELR
jgi:hypothetical protein